MLRLPCSKGFGVGHKRETQTKGLWIWGAPEKVQVGGESVTMVMVDTEGFESAGRAQVYDDRVFALSAMMASVLLYNLPETVKEADVEKLSFTVQLAAEFFDRTKQTTVQAASSLAMPSLIWLIQRDFLQGTTVTEMVERVLGTK